MTSRSKLPAVVIALAVTLALINAWGAFEQRTNYYWMEMPRKDAERLLTNSPWSHTQVDTDLSEQFYSPTRPGTSSIGQSGVSRGSASSQQSINNSRAD